MDEVTTDKISKRLLTLDYLRGTFIAIIIIDHLSRWPSFFELFTGKALLWITAAEGFVIISGLLVGYVRGYKNAALPFQTVAGKTIKRALILYLWSIIATVVYTALMWYVFFIGHAPSSPIATGDWLGLLYKTITLQYTFVWVYFLTLYALFLAASPLAIWLMRHGKAWLVLVISLIVLAFGWQTHLDGMQWQALFFIPAVAGFYLEPIRRRWLALPKTTEQRIRWVIWGVSLLTIALSVLATYYAPLAPTILNYLDGLFAKDTISIWRLLLAFIWFGGALLLFNRFGDWIGQRLGWLLLPFGTRSLSAYIVHGLALCIISFFIISNDNVFINSLLDICAIGIVWSLLRIPLVQRVLPR